MYIEDIYNYYVTVHIIVSTNSLSSIFSSGNYLFDRNPRTGITAKISWHELEN